MKRLSLVLSCALVLACAAKTPPPTARSAQAPPLSPVPPALGADGDASSGFAASAHVFTPRPRPAHTRPAPTFVEPQRLPKLRYGTCSRETARPKGALAPSQSSGAVSGQGYGYSYGGGVGSGMAVPQAAPSRPALAAPMAPAKKAREEGASSPRNAAVGAERRTRADRAAAPEPSPAPAEFEAKKSEVSRDAADARAPAREQAANRAGDPTFAPRDDAAIARGDSSEPRAYHDFGASIYLSNDDTMSLSSAQRVIYAIDRFLPIAPEHVRPHELLNYFSFATAPVAPNDDFSVHAEIEPKPGEPGVYTLGLSVSGRELDRADRRNAALTFVVDRSGSMSAEGRMSYLKQGLRRMTNELKRGDLVNLVLFDHEACSSLENFVVGRDASHLLTAAIDRLEPRGSTDVNSGLRLGYSLAEQSYQTTHSNRVVLITDALANTGVTDPELMSMVSAHYDKRRIRLSGVGVGSEFNDALLDRLTERGRGAYVFLGSPAEVDAVFGERFVSLIETTANDVHFKLSLPPSLGMKVFYGEESSTRQEDVQAIHYFAGTSQLFLSDLVSRTPALRTEDSLMLSVEYEHPDTGARQHEDFVFELGKIAGASQNVKKGRLVMSFIDGLADTIRSQPSRSDSRHGGWLDASAAEQCERGKSSLTEQARGLGHDVEAERVVKLWDQYCSRYEAVRAPVRRTPPRGGDVWPSARR